MRSASVVKAFQRDEGRLCFSACLFSVVFLLHTFIVHPHNYGCHSKFSTAQNPLSNTKMLLNVLFAVIGGNCEISPPSLRLFSDIINTNIQ